MPDDPDHPGLDRTPAAASRAFGTAYGPPDKDGLRTRFSVIGYLAPADRYLIVPLGNRITVRADGPLPPLGHSGWVCPDDLHELVVAHPVRTRSGGRTICHHHVVPTTPATVCRTCLIRPPQPGCRFFRTSRYAPISEEES
ncbi:hypothetical protein AB0D10_25055 [Kitasatospora sp. NPDC048545]|uniref:hypothetical protein n=1 Tax=Kitasatospora sp. NPDC048545 TaxID=3157208 RepID=UPI0033CA41FE